MCFFRRLQRHNTTTSFFNTLTFTITHSHTHTHTHDWPTVADRSSGSRYFSGFANIFDPKEGSQVFLTARGSRNIRKYFQSVKNVSFVYVCFCMQALCCNDLRLR